jgi:hypothetical protein
MGLFGKILLVVNLLASGGFIYLALQDYKGRQTINAVGLRHVILRDGLPLEGGPDTLPPRAQPTADNYSDFISTQIPFPVEGSGGTKIESVSPEFLYAYFTQAGDAAGDPLAGTTPVASQMAEVKRVWGIIKGLVDKGDGFAAKAQLAAPFILYQAESYEERADYLDWIAKNNGAELLHALDIQFHRVSPKVVEATPLNPSAWAALPDAIRALEAERDAAVKAADAAKAAGNAAEEEKQRALAGQKTSAIARRRTAPPEDEVDRRRRLAHLLIHLDRSAPWQKRVEMVIGTRNYAPAVDAQVADFKQMIERVEDYTVKDQQKFSGEYARLRAQAIERTQRTIEKAIVRAQLVIQATKDQDLVNQRQLQLDDLLAQLTKFKEEVNILLAKQTMTEKRLFEIEKEIELTVEAVFQLDAELRMREFERYNKK